MGRVFTIPRAAAALATLLLASGCAHSPRVMDETPSVISFRSDFLESHPDGPYHEYIRRGEVARGMGYMEVLASWGVPGSRYRVDTDEGGVEYWHYVSHDELSHDYTQYTFVFEKNRVSGWDVLRHVSRNATLSHWRIPQESAYPGVDATRNLATETVRK